MAGFSDTSHLNVLKAREEYVPICLNSLRIDSITNFDLYIRLGENAPHVLYCERNVPFNDEARQRLIDNEVSQVYISADQRREYGRYIENHIEAILDDPRISVEEKAEILYASAYGVVEDFLTEPDVQTGVRRTKEVVRHAVSSMFHNRIQFNHLLNVLSVDYFIYTHSVNVTAYSVALAQRMGYRDPATLRELANGALLHDIGKSWMDPAIVHAKGRLTAEQWEELKRHPIYGYRMLSQHDGLGEIALDIILHHHEKLSGSGYPDGLSGGAISPFVRMVTIADIFDALTTERSFQKARGSFAALNLMAEEIRNDLDPHLFRVFVGLMGNPE